MRSRSAALLSGARAEAFDARPRLFASSALIGAADVVAPLSLRGGAKAAG